MASPVPRLDIPQLVVIHDPARDTYKHPILHYVFENEEFPDVPRDKLIVVDLDETAANVAKVDSYSPHFQVTHCTLEQSTVTEQFEDGGVGLLNLTIQGISAPPADEAIQSLQSVRNMDALSDMIANFKMRNELVRAVFQEHGADNDGASGT